MEDNIADVLDCVTKTILDKKGENLVVLKTDNPSVLAKYMVIADGFVDKHVCAIAKELISNLKGIGIRNCGVEGLECGDWVAMDFFDVVVHLLIPDLRKKYKLEELWG